MKSAAVDDDDENDNHNDHVSDDDDDDNDNIFECEDDYHTGCQNFRQCQQQSSSKLHSQEKSCSRQLTYKYFILTTNISRVTIDHIRVCYTPLMAKYVQDMYNVRYVMWKSDVE